ncbi:hypothetical protein KHP62_07970 [Rhodobacteraceae bacterium NNCM2]|nr:hypothetical protein [Coraliihabitans acroporae]
MSIEDEFFGSSDQKALTYRSSNLWRLMCDDKRVSYYGRTVSLTCYEPGATELLLALTRLQGAASFLYVHARHIDEVVREIEANGMKVDRFETLTGGPECLDAAQEIVTQYKLPDDLEVVILDEDTPASLLGDLDQLTRECGVLLLRGSMLRGVEKPGLCIVALDAGKKPVGVAAAVAINHPEGKQGKDAWWGMLATREDRRGEHISLILGAMTMLEMNRRHGFSHFITGVRKGNTASENLCAKLAILPSAYGIVTAIDPSQFAGGRVTK